MTSLHKKLPVNGHKEASVYVILKGNIKILANDENIFFISKEQFTMNGSMNQSTYHQKLHSSTITCCSLALLGISPSYWFFSNQEVHLTLLFTHRFQYLKKKFIIKT